MNKSESVLYLQVLSSGGGRAVAEEPCRGQQARLRQDDALPLRLQVGP